MAKRKNEDPEKKVKRPTKSQPEIQYSICVPSSAISPSNARNLQQITHVAYQIAKCATIFNSPEIVILDIPDADARQLELEREATKAVKTDKKITFNEIDPAPESEKDNSANDNALLLATLLQFFVTPPYLVKSVFQDSPMNKKFKYAQQLPKITTLPFMNNNGVLSDFKEGLSIPKKSPGTSNTKNKLKSTKYVNIGEDKPLELTQDIPVNVRVTVDIKNKKVVSPAAAYGVVGNKSSFGYYTRIAKTFSDIFTQSSFADGYTSSVYVHCADYFNNDHPVANQIPITKENNQVLLVLGSPKDLDYSFAKDKMGVDDFKQLFDHQLAISPNVRVEEALLMALTKVASPN